MARNNEYTYSRQVQDLSLKERLVLEYLGFEAYKNQLFCSVIPLYGKNEEAISDKVVKWLVSSVFPALAHMQKTGIYVTFSSCGPDTGYFLSKAFIDNGRAFVRVPEKMRVVEVARLVCETANAIGFASKLTTNYVSGTLSCSWLSQNEQTALSKMSGDSVVKALECGVPIKDILA